MNHYYESKQVQTTPYTYFFLIKLFQITPLYARIRHLKFGNQRIWNLNMVNYVKNLSDLGTNVIKHGIGAIVKTVEIFAKRHVINANILQIQHFHTLPTLTTNYELNDGLTC